MQEFFKFKKGIRGTQMSTSHLQNPPTVTVLDKVHDEARYESYV